MKLRPWHVAFLLFGSGLSALVYQTVWLRQFRLIFGASTLASAAVLAIFMGGLGFGGIYLGRRADTVRRPLEFYARLELLVALSAAITPFLLWLVGLVYQGIGGTPALGYTFGTILRLILSTVVLLVPTMLMGGTLPAASRAIETELDVSRSHVALLYGTNTCGAVAGVLLSTFFLLEHLGNRTTLWLACVVNVGVALIAMLLDRAARRAEVRSPQETLEDASTSQAPRSFVLAAAGVVGFAFLLMELVWYRMLTPLLGGTSFTFGVILAVALLGIGSGGLLYATRRESSEGSLHGFAFVCALEALAIGVPFALGDRIAVLALFLRPLGGFGFGGFLAGWFLVTMVVVFPVAVVAGYQFPLLIALLGRGREAVGRHVGLAYAWNTVGAIVGSLAGGFGLLPLLGATGVWRLVTLPLLVLAIAAILLSRERAGRLTQSFATILLVVGTLAAISVEGPTSAWRHSPIGAGRSSIANATPNRIHDWRNDRNRVIIWEKEGVESSIALSNDDGLAFLINGKSDGNSRYDAGTQVMGGLVGGILHANPRRALVIGLGTGSTAGWLAAIPSMERVDVVELEPAIREVARACSPLNERVLENPKVHVYTGDAREVLLTNKQKYDIIFSEPSNPFRAGVASLFTDTFYSAALGRLQPGGLFLQWVQAYEIDVATLRTVYATMTSVFPAVETWTTMRKDLLLVASAAPVLYDAEHLRGRIAETPFREALARTWRVHDLEGFLARYVCGNPTATIIANGAQMNSDDRTVIEFAFARAVGDQSLFDPRLMRTLSARHSDTLPRIRGSVDRDLVAIRRLSIEASENAAPYLVPGSDEMLQQRASALAGYVHSDYPRVVSAWATQRRPPSDEIELLSIAEALAEQGDDRALPLITALEAVAKEEADVTRARYLARKGETDQAFAALELALGSYRSNPWPLSFVMSRGLDLATTLAAADPSLVPRFSRLLAQPFSLYLLEEKRKTFIANLAGAVERGECGPLSRAAVAAYGEHPPWQRRFLETRLRCARGGDPAVATAAAEDLRDFMETEPLPLDDAVRRP